MNTNCKNCNNQINDDIKFCGKCGNEIEQEKITETIELNSDNDLEQQKLIEDVKTVGTLFNIFGYFKVIFAVLILLSLITNSDILNGITLGYPDIVVTIIIGVLFILLGGRVSKDINKNSRKYLLIIFWVLIIEFLLQLFIVVNINITNGTNQHPSIIPLLIAIFANKGLRKLKLINIKN